LRDVIPFARNKVENRCIGLLTKLGKQFSEVEKASEFLSPNRWVLSFPEVLQRRILSRRELKRMIEFIQNIGIPRTAKKEIDIQRFVEGLELEYVSEDCVRASASEIESFSKGIPFIDQSVLLPIFDHLTEELRASLGEVIEEMEEIHEFVSEWSNMKTIKALKAPKHAPEWWNWKCDLGLVKAASIYGQKPVREWAFDEELPFHQYLKGEDSVSELRFIFREKNRFERIHAVIASTKTERRKDPETIIPPYAVNNSLTVTSITEGSVVGYRGIRKYRSIEAEEGIADYEVSVRVESGAKIFRIKEGEHQFEGSTASECAQLLADEIEKRSSKPRRHIAGDWFFGFNIQKVAAVLSKKEQ
jgi:hypothetical protein